jgi:glycogen synthase
MKHLIICREYPPAPLPAGGIGTYAHHISRLLAGEQETVHVVSQLWKGAQKQREELLNGHLIIHRIPYGDGDFKAEEEEAQALFQSDFPPQSFSFCAALYAERLITEEGIDLIEAQEYEAPLYYFQIRRALCLGPKALPPCMIHLHSPTEYIVHYNDWDPNYIYFRTTRRLESYSIASADSLLCPSRYLATRVETQFGLSKGSVNIIPYPIGDNEFLERDPDIWKRGSVIYIGRLERRKGVLEWIDAAVDVAREHPSVHFEFVGSNILHDGMHTGAEIVESRIPLDLKDRFLFHGEQEPSNVRRILKQARIAVIPSRWENFPNTCIEAMSSGIPVIVSPNGGMMEVFENGRTGWVAENGDKAGLSRALKQALHTEANLLAEMGNRASLRVRMICSNEKILEEQLSYRRKVVARKSVRSLRVNLPSADISAGNRAKRNNFGKTEQGIAVIVSAFENIHLLPGCLENLDQQSRKPAVVVMLLPEESKASDLQYGSISGSKTVRAMGLVTGKNLSVAAVLEEVPNPSGFIFLRAEDRLALNALELLERILLECHDVGLVSFWIKQGKRMQISPCPAFPYQWIANEVVHCSAMRKEALMRTQLFQPQLLDRFDEWDVFNSILATGWIGVTVPILLCRSSDDPSRLNGHTEMKMRALVLDRFPDLVSQQAGEIIRITASNAIWADRQRLREANRNAKENQSSKPILIELIRRTKNKIGLPTPVWISRLLRRSRAIKNE